MRVVFCSDSLPPLVDGVTRTLREVIGAIQDSSVDFLFLSAVTPHATLPWRDRVRTVASVPFPLYPCYRLGLPRARHLDPLLDRFAPDLIHVVTPSLLGLYGVKYAKRRGLPVVASFHTDFVSLFRYFGLRRLEWLGRRLARRFYGQCAVTLAPSRNTADRLRAYGIANVALWQRGVDSRSFSPAFRSAALRARVGASDDPVLLYVGRLGREKNLGYLTEAMGLLARRGARFKLVIVGDGPMRRALQERLPQAHFTGYVGGEELSRWYASADVFVFPSIAETFGNVVLEAFASGLPVVAVDRGSVRELVTPGTNGLLAPADAPAAFAERVHALMTRPAEVARMGLEARITAARYRWPDITRQLLEHYGRAVGSNGHGAPRPIAVAV